MDRGEGEGDLWDGDEGEWPSKRLLAGARPGSEFSQTRPQDDPTKYVP